jgi:4-hydroxybenzoate polyprenyltransferase
MTVSSGQGAAAQLVVSSRPLSWINTAFPFAAAYFLATGRVDAALVIGSIYFLVPYNLAMYGINDVFDFESDLRNPRKGGLEGALLEKRMHAPTIAAALVTNVPFLIVLAAIGSPASWVVLAVSVFSVIAYSSPGLRFKEKPVLDSITSSAHFVSPAVYGLVLAGAAFTPQLLGLLLAFFLWGVATHAFGAVQDVLPDRQARIASIATVLGAHRTVRLSIGCWSVAGIAMLFTVWPGPLGALLVVPYIVAATPYWSVDDDYSERANRAWKRFLWLNYAAGFVATVLLTGYAATR